MNPYYEHSGITIYHADWRECGLQSEFDLLLTDPPYGIGFAAQPTKWQRRAGMTPKTWDDSTVDMSSVLSLARQAIVWGGNYYSLPISRGWLAWCKPDAPPSMGNLELAWSSLDLTARYFVQSISATNPERVGHPTQKPLGLMKWCLTRILNCESVVDPFMGSGTSLLAAQAFGMRATGVEVEERYCEIAAKRLAQEVLF